MPSFALLLIDQGRASQGRVATLTRTGRHAMVGYADRGYIECWLRALHRVLVEGI